MDKTVMKSISVNPLTLKWVNTIKAHMEYETGERLTMDLTLLYMASHYDYMIQMATHRSKDDYDTFIKKRIAGLATGFTDEESKLVDDAFEFLGARCAGCGNRLIEGKCINQYCQHFFNKDKKMGA